MATANTKPIFAIKGNSGGVLMNAASTAVDGTGTVGTDIFKVLESPSAGAGTIVTAIVFTSSQTTAGASTPRMCRIFLTDSSGANPGIVGEIPLPSVTRSDSIIGATATFYFPKPLVLSPGQRILVSQSKRTTTADDTYAYAIAGDYSL